MWAYRCYNLWAYFLLVPRYNCNRNAVYILRYGHRHSNKVMWTLWSSDVIPQKGFIETDWTQHFPEASSVPEVPQKSPSFRTHCTTIGGTKTPPSIGAFGTRRLVSVVNFHVIFLWKIFLVMKYGRVCIHYSNQFFPAKFSWRRKFHGSKLFERLGMKNQNKRLILFWVVILYFCSYDVKNIIFKRHYLFNVLEIHARVSVKTELQKNGRWNCQIFW
jgi:hypothetical protein